MKKGTCEGDGGASNVESHVTHDTHVTHETHLDAALDGCPQQIEGKHGVSDDGEQGEGGVEVDDDGVEEGAQAVAAVEQQLQDDLHLQHKLLQFLRRGKPRALHVRSTIWR